MVKLIINPVIGEIEFTEDQIIRFEEGMLGLPGLKEYLLLTSDNIAPFLRLQCVEEPKISFLLLDPNHVDPGYKDYVSSRSGIEEYYRINDPENAIFVVMKISEDGEEISANLVAPVVIDNRNKSGQQVVLIDSPYNVRQSLSAGAPGEEG